MPPMLSPMSRDQVRPELFKEGLREVFQLGQASIDSKLPIIFHKLNSTQSAEEMMSWSGIGLFTQLPEGTPINYQTIEARYKSIFRHLDYATGIRYTKRLMRDLKYIAMSDAAQQFGMAAKATQEILGTSFLNTGFTTIWNAEEGKAFFATDHPLSVRAITATKSYGNLITGDISYDTLQEAISLLENTPNDLGYPSHIKAQYLLHHPTRRFLVKEILQSPGIHTSANLAKNTLADELIPVSCPFITEPSSFFVRGNIFNTMWFDRDPLETDMETDFDTKDLKHSAMFACSWGAKDWRGWVGSAGT